MHDERKKINYAPWAIAVGAVLVIASVILRPSKQQPPPPSEVERPSPVATKCEPSEDREIVVSEQMIDAMAGAALSENPALR